MFECKVSTCLPLLRSRASRPSPSTSPEPPELTRPIRDGLAQLLRAIAHERADGRFLAARVDFALRDLIQEVRLGAGYQDGDDLVLP